MRGRLHARRRAQASSSCCRTASPRCVVVAAERRRQLERHEVVERDAGVGRLQVLQAAHEQPGAEEQQEAERDLRGDEPLAQEQRSAACRRSIPSCPSASSTDRAGWRAAPAAGRRRCRSTNVRPSVNAEDRADRAARVISSGWPSRRHEREQRRASARTRAPRPTTPPANDSTRLSTSSCRTSRPRDAPSDSRTAISFCRMKPRAISRFATLAQAMSSTRPTMHISTTSARREVVAQRRVADRRAASTSSCPFMNCSREYADQSFAAGSVISYCADLREQPLQRRLRRFDRVARLQPREHLHPARARDRPCAASPTRAPSTGFIRIGHADLRRLRADRARRSPPPTRRRSSSDSC